jgi:hypothetical protein
MAKEKKIDITKEIIARNHKIYELYVRNVDK